MKIVQSFGSIASFDFLYGMNDRGGRIPRGYAFVTYKEASSAESAIKQLNRKKIMERVRHFILFNAISKNLICLLF